MSFASKVRGAAGGRPRLWWLSNGAAWKRAVLREAALAAALAGLLAAMSWSYRTVIDGQRARIADLERENVALAGVGPLPKITFVFALEASTEEELAMRFAKIADAADKERLKLNRYPQQPRKESP